MKYAHIGSSSDNALTLEGTQPTREFRAYPNSEGRKVAQDEVWAQSNGNQNLIFVTYKELKAIWPKFYVGYSGRVFESEDIYFSQHCEDEETDVHPRVIDSAWQIAVHESKFATRIIQFARQGCGMSDDWWNETYDLDQYGEIYGVYLGKNGGLRRNLNSIE